MHTGLRATTSGVPTRGFSPRTNNSPLTVSGNGPAPPLNSGLHNVAVSNCRGLKSSETFQSSLFGVTARSCIVRFIINQNSEAECTAKSS